MHSRSLGKNKRLPLPSLVSRALRKEGARTRTCYSYLAQDIPLAGMFGKLIPTHIAGCGSGDTPPYRNYYEINLCCPFRICAQFKRPTNSLCFAPGYNTPALPHLSRKEKSKKKRKKSRTESDLSRNRNQKLQL